MSTVPALAVHGLHVRYGSSAPVLHGLDLEVAPGGCTAVLGPSGCGKSTLLRAIAGLTRAAAGRIEIGGVTTDAPAQKVRPENRSAALVFQDLALWPHMTVAGNLGFVLEARGVPRGEREAETLEACAAVGLPGELLERRPGELSGGERQRAALARAIVQEPRVLLLDEPLTGLDRHLRRRLLETLAALRRERGLGMLVVTHDHEEAFALADRVAVMRDGVVIQEGTPQDVYQRPATAFVAGFVGAASLLAAAVTNGRMQTPLGAFDADGVADGAWRAVFRPDAIGVAEAGEGVRGVVETSFYRGGYFLVGVRLADPQAPGEAAQRSSPVLVRTASALRPGTEVALVATAPVRVPLTDGDVA